MKENKEELIYAIKESFQRTLIDFLQSREFDEWYYDRVYDWTEFMEHDYHDLINEQLETLKKEKIEYESRKNY